MDGFLFFSSFEQMQFLSSMDIIARNRETSVSKSVGNLLLKKDLRDAHCNMKKSNDSSIKNHDTNCQTGNAFTNSLLEKKRRDDYRKTEENPDSLNLEALHVRRVYDQIAPHIQNLKQKTWPCVKDFLKSLPPGSIVADVGCGNGRYLRINPTIYKIGSDICRPFLQSASARGHEVLSADNLSLPYRDDFFDAAISVGVIHHFASEERRIQALCELVRIVRTGGLMMVYVWAFEQKYRKFDSQDILVPWHKPSRVFVPLTKATESGHTHPRLSSLPDTDHLSTSSTGSSVSDDDFVACACHLQNSSKSQYDNAMKASHDLYESSSATPVHEQIANGTCVAKNPDINRVVRKHKKHFGDKGCFRELSAKGDALIRECQKVESYLSSLSNHPLDSFSEMPKPSNGMSKMLPLDSFDDECTNISVNTTASPSNQDDDVFLLEQPDQKSVAKSHIYMSKDHKGDNSLRADDLQQTQRMQHRECAFDNFSQRDGNNDNHYFLHQCSSQLIMPDSVDKSFSKRRNHEQFCGHCLTNESLPNPLTNSSLESGPNFPLKKDSVDFDDEFCVIEFENGRRRVENVDFENGKIPAEKQLHSDHSKPVGSFQNVLRVLKEGFKNILTTSKSKNGQHSAPCFMSCIGHPHIKECFQIREFPQSSLPSLPVFEQMQFGKGNTQIKDDGVNVCPADHSLSSLSNAEKITKSFSRCHSLPEECCLKNQNGIKKKTARHYFPTRATVKCSKSCNTRSRSHHNSLDSVHDLEGSTYGSESTIPRLLRQRSQHSFLSSPTEMQKDNVTNTDLCRFYHVFCEGELENLVRQNIPDVQVVDSFYDHANWCLILKKI